MRRLPDPRGLLFMKRAVLNATGKTERVCVENTQRFSLATGVWPR